MSLLDDIKAKFSGSSDSEIELAPAPADTDCAYIYAIFPKDGVPQIKVVNGQIMSIPKIQMLDRLILREIRLQRSRALHEERTREEASNEAS